MQLSIKELLASEPEDRARALLDAVDDKTFDVMVREWVYSGRGGQLPPPGDWRVWLILAGRGFGKTRAGAEWVRMAARSGTARIALVAADLAEARTVMVEGASGILAVSPAAERPLWAPALRRLTWPTGARAMLFSAADPDSLRGPEHSHACRAGPERTYA